MHEDLLQFIWDSGLFNATELTTTAGDAVEVVSRGTLNTVAGPDFLNAKVQVNGTLWAGCIEIHTRSSLWDNHQHNFDSAYDNVVLHVVYDHDLEVKNSKGEVMPTVELRGRVKRTVMDRFEYLRANERRIPCSDHFPNYPGIQFKAWLERVLVERLARKTDDIDQLFAAAGSDWLQTFYVLMAGFFGQNHNKLPFQELARSVPINLLAKHADDPVQIEALLFGTAGLLPASASEDYVTKRITEYRFLQRKYGLSVIVQPWKFGGIRPHAFPTRRLALLAALVPHLQQLHSALLSGEEIRLHEMELCVDDFWARHYTFSQSNAEGKPLGLSKAFSALLETNAIAPYLFFYGKQHGDESTVEKAVHRLYEVEAEQNAVTKRWADLGFHAKTAAESQALIELNTHYCNVKNCVLCNVGKSIISKS